MKSHRLQNGIAAKGQTRIENAPMASTAVHAAIRRSRTNPRIMKGTSGPSTIPLNSRTVAYTSPSVGYTYTSSAVPT